MTCSFFFSSRRRHTSYWRDWSSDVCSSDLEFLRVRSHIERPQLFEAPHQKCELGLKGGAAVAFVKRIQKRIGFRLRSEERRVGKECRSRWKRWQRKEKQDRMKQMATTNRTD